MCPDWETLSQFADGELEEEKRGVLLDHLDSCGSCQVELFQLKMFRKQGEQREWDCPISLETARLVCTPQEDLSKTEEQESHRDNCPDCASVWETLRQAERTDVSFGKLQQRFAEYAGWKSKESAQPSSTAESSGQETAPVSHFSRPAVWRWGLAAAVLMAAAGVWGGSLFYAGSQPADREAVGENGRTFLSLNGSGEIEVAAGSVWDWNRSAQRLTLDSGRVRIDSGGATVTVRTPFGEVRNLATVFEVEVSGQKVDLPEPFLLSGLGEEDVGISDRGEGMFRAAWVDVAEGKVRIRSNGRSVEIPAGSRGFLLKSGDPFFQEIAPLSEEDREGILSGLRRAARERNRAEWESRLAVLLAAGVLEEEIE